MRTILHLGLMKTGTSALQYHVFPRLDGVWYWHWEHNWTRALRDARPTDTTTLLSCEAFSAGPWSATGWREAQARNEHLLGGLFPGADLIVVLREQGAWCRSLYHQYLHEGGTATFPALFEPFLEEAAPSPLLFAPYLDRLKKTFSGRILVVDFDLMRKDWGAFRQTLQTFLGVPLPNEKPPIHNRSVQRLQARTLRTLNRLHRGAAAEAVTRHGGRLGRAIIRRSKAWPRPVLQDRAHFLGRFGDELVHDDLLAPVRSFCADDLAQWTQRLHNGSTIW